AERVYNNANALSKMTEELPKNQEQQNEAIGHYQEAANTNNAATEDQKQSIQEYPKEYFLEGSDEEMEEIP
ncbi:8816_t:CDS:2, partial [Gigaspora margarita]